MAASGKKFPYVVILKNTTDRPFSILAVLLNLAAAALFTREFIFRGNIHYVNTIALVIFLSVIVWNIVIWRKGIKPYFNIAYLIAAALWMDMPYMQWVVLPLIVLALLEHQVKHPLEIGFSETQIVLNTLFRKKYKWSQLSNVMLKDGLLTMDFINNRILQREVEDDDEEDDAAEEEFNLFCREQLKKNTAELYGNFR